jgi:hypothetical protein
MDRGINMKAKVSAKAAKLAESPTGDKAINSPELPCNGKPKKVWHHVGLGISVRQYDIGTRKQGLEMPAIDNAGIKEMDVLHKTTGNAFPIAGNGEVSVLKMYPPDKGVGFRATVTMGANSLREESGSKENTFHIDAKSCANLNSHLGRALAIHFSRSGVFSPYPSEIGLTTLRNAEPGLSKTDMMGAKIFLYLRIALDGEAKAQIREIVNGKLFGNVIAPEEYEKRKLIQTPQAASDKGGAMPLIQGVYQLHVLFDGAGGQFSVAEIHCDGDPLPIT